MRLTSLMHATLPIFTSVPVSLSPFGTLQPFFAPFAPSSLPLRCATALMISDGSLDEDDNGCDDSCSIPDETFEEEVPMAFRPGELEVLSLPNSPDTSLSHVDVVTAVWCGALSV